MIAWCYILRLKSGRLYIGSTTNIDQRYKDHLNGRDCQTTKNDPPIKLIYSEEFKTLTEGRKRETQLKKWSRAKKEALIAGDIVKLQELAKSRRK